VDKVAYAVTVSSNSYQPNAQNKNIYIYTQVHFKRKSGRLRMLRDLPPLQGRLVPQRDREVRLGTNTTDGWTFSEE
jgi:hypothetical protein